MDLRDQGWDVPDAVSRDPAFMRALAEEQEEDVLVFSNHCEEEELVLEGGYDMKGLYNGLNNHLKKLVEYSNE